MVSFEKFYKNKRVLVTGGAGFIGSHLVERLVHLGANVTIMDNFSTGSLSNIKSVAHLINLFYADIRSAYSCTKAVANQDIVFHLAAFISVAESLINPDVCHKINAEGTNNILDACQKHGIKMFIFSSSSAVYGCKNGVCAENDPLNPQSPYAKSKYEGECATQKYTQTASCNAAILRYFNVYGDRQSPHGSYAAVVARFKKQLLSEEPLTIFGDGKQTRDFIHVSKVVEANLFLGLQQNLHGEIFNIGSGKSMNLLQLIEHLEHELQIKRTTITFMPARHGDITHSLASCTKLQQFMQSQP